MAFDEAPDVELPDWLTALGSRPLVYVTMGTEFNKELAVFRAILDGLAGGRFDVVVTVGPSGDPEALRPYADNVRIERFIPQSSLLPHAAAFVSHAGSGATLGALACRRPDARDPAGRRPVPQRRARSSTRASGFG